MLAEWNLTCTIQDGGCSATKRWGKRFRVAFLADISSQKPGGPPHRASDFFICPNLFAPTYLFQLSEERT
jgi:hypothetical protein